MNISGDISGSSIPGSSFYDLSRAMKSRVQIESFCQRISTDLYLNPEIAMTNFEPDDHLTVYLSLSQELSQLKSSLDASSERNKRNVMVAVLTCTLSSDYPVAPSMCRASSPFIHSICTS